MDFWGEGSGVGRAQNGQGAPHLLHDLQVVDTGRLDVAIYILLAMVVVAVVFDADIGAHKNAGLFALGGAKWPMSSFLYLGLLLWWDLSPDLFKGADFFINLIWLGWKGLFSSLFSSLNASIFFLSDGKGFIHLLQWLQIADLVVWSFLYALIPLTMLTVTSISIVSSGRAHWKNLDRKLQVGFSSKTIVCKNICTGLKQFLLEDYWKPMWTNQSLVLTWCERVMVLSSSYV